MNHFLLALLVFGAVTRVGAMGSALGGPHFKRANTTAVVTAEENAYVSDGTFIAIIFFAYTLLVLFILWGLKEYAINRKNFNTMLDCYQQEEYAVSKPHIKICV